MKKVFIGVGGVLAAYLLFLTAQYFASVQRPDLVKRINAAGGFEALKQDCLVVMGGFGEFLNPSEYPRTITALRPKRVGAGGGSHGNVIMAWFELDDCGIYVAPRGCPPDFMPVRPGGHPQAWKVAGGVFAYKRPTRARHAWIYLREIWYESFYALTTRS
jgi:hypothetical protein